MNPIEDFNIVNFLFLLAIIAMLTLLLCNKCIKFILMVRTQKLDAEKMKVLNQKFTGL